MQRVREYIMVYDVSGTGFKLTEVRRDVVAPSKGTSRCRSAHP